MKFLGLTRFNVVTQNTLGSFRATKGKTLDEAKAAVYTEKNLSQRLQLLKSFCLPTYAALSDNSNSFGVIIINHDLPEPYQSEVRALCSAIPRMHVIALPDDGGYAKWIKPALNEILGDDDVYSYRFDDDDALPVNYLDKVEDILNASDMAEMIISFNHGYSLTKLAEDNFGFRVRHYPMNAFGLGRFSLKGAFKQVFELGSHSNLRGRIHNERDTIGWLSTVHEGNDSHVGKAKISGVPMSEILDSLSTLFPHISTSALQNLSVRRAPDSK